MKSGMRLLFFLFISFTSHAQTSSEKYNLEIFDFNTVYPSPCEDTSKPCYTVEDLVKLTIESGINAREGVQSYYQARQTIKVNRGFLLPQINVLNVVDTAMSPGFSIDIIVPLVGFLFPNRWHNLQASKELWKAQYESLSALFGNIALNIQQLYFNIQYQIWAIRVLEFFIKELDETIEYLTVHTLDNGEKKATAEDLAVLYNIKGKWMNQLGFIDNLSAYYPQLAIAAGFDPNIDWSSMNIEPHAIGSILNKKEPEYGDLWKLALPRSPEIKNAQYLIKAAIQNKRATYTSFIDPASGINFGYGYGHSIKIARSNVEVLALELYNAQLQLSFNLQNNKNNLGDALNAAPGVELALKSLEDLRAGVDKHLNDDTVPLDINRLWRYFTFAQGQALSYVYNYFFYQTSQTILDRYTWTTRTYELVKEYIAEKLPEFVHNVKKQHAFREVIKRKFKRHHDKHADPEPFSMTNR